MSLLFPYIACRAIRNELGLSLADAVQFFVCQFCARPGAKLTHHKHKVPCCRRQTCCERKSYERMSFLLGSSVVPYRRVASAGKHVMPLEHLMEIAQRSSRPPAIQR